MGYNLFEAALNGVAFSSLGQEDELVLVDIVEEEAKMDTQTVSMGLHDGKMRTVSRRESLSVKLEFCIRTQDVARRAELRDAVAEWASKGGDLTINTRPGKMLQVKCDTAVALQSSAKWTESIVLTLTAYEIPFWQSVKATTLSFYMQTSNADGYFIAEQLHPDGNAGDVKVEAMISHIGDAPLTHMRISCGSTFFEFDGMHVEPGSVITISYTDGILSVLDFTKVEGDNSLLRFRTPDSSDDLIAKANEDNHMNFHADQRLQGQITARGRWL